MNQISLNQTGGKHMVQAPWPLSSNEQQATLQGEKNVTVVEVGYKNTLQEIPEVIQLKLCVVQRIFARDNTPGILKVSWV